MRSFRASLALALMVVSTPCYAADARPAQPSSTDDAYRPIAYFGGYGSWSYSGPWRPAYDRWASPRYRWFYAYPRYRSYRPFGPGRWDGHAYARFARPGGYYRGYYGPRWADNAFYRPRWRPYRPYPELRDKY